MSRAASKIAESSIVRTIRVPAVAMASPHQQTRQRHRWNDIAGKYS